MRPSVGSVRATPAPNGHEFYPVIGADSFEDVSGVLWPPALQDHDGAITPVIEFENVAGAVLDD